MDEQNNREPNPFFNHTAEQASELSNNQNNAIQTNNQINSGNNNNGMATANNSIIPNNKQKQNHPAGKDNTKKSDGEKNNDKKDKPAGKEENSSKKPTLNVKDKVASAAKNTVKGIGNTAKNAANNTLNNIAGEDGEKSSEDQEISNLVNKTKDVAAKTTKLIGKGLKKLFMLLPLPAKIAIICTLLLIIIIILILFLFIGSSGVDYESEAIKNVKLVDGDIEYTIVDYVSSVIKENNGSNTDEDYIAAVTIYIASNVYVNYDEMETFSISENFGDIKYDKTYVPLPVSCRNVIDTGTDDVVDDDQLSQCQADFTFNTSASEDEIVEYYENTKVVEKFANLYIEDPTLIDDALLKRIKDLSDEGKTYQEIINIIEEMDIEIYTLGIPGGTSGLVNGVREQRPEPGNPYYPLQTYWNFQCVWYARYRAIEILSTNGGSQEKINAIMNTQGNGKNWGSSNPTLSANFKTDPTCTNFRAGSIIAWDATDSNSFGHVGIIEKVDAENGLVYISEGWNSAGGGHASATDTDWSHFHFEYKALSMETAKDRKGYGGGVCTGLTYLLD